MMHALLILIVMLCSTFSQNESGAVVPYNDENIGNCRYISILILHIYQRYINKHFEEKKSISLKLIKTYENIEKNSKNDIINNNRHLKVVL